MDFKIVQKGSSVYIDGITEKTIKIPSQMYPLTGQTCCMARSNTKPFDENKKAERIRTIFDSIPAGIGTCYTNVEKLMAILSKESFKAQSFVGWSIIGDALPVHHCFAVIDNHILDFSLKPSNFFKDELKGKDMAETRELFTQEVLRLKELPNSQKGTFGQLDDYTFLVASPCNPSTGRNIYQKLMKAFPKHPCYQNVTNGTNPTQRMLFEKNGGIF